MAKEKTTEVEVIAEAVIPQRRFQDNYHRYEFPKEYNSMPSEVVPSKSLSLREIISRDLTNMVLPASDATPFYDETIFVPDFKRMDIAQMEQYKLSLQRQKETIENSIREEYRERKQAERDKLAKERQSKASEKSESDESVE